MSRRDRWLAALATLVALPALGGGLLLDDWFHRLTLSGRWPIPHDSIFGLYDFIPGGDGNRPLFAIGALPWFSHPELRVRFFRPLSSATLALDAWLFADQTWVAHAHSLAWFGACGWLVWRIHRSLLPERLAFLATLVFSLAAAHAQATAWLSARHVLVGGAFALAGWLTHLRWRRGVGGGLAVAGWLLLGFASSEVALGVVPLALAWELGRHPATRQERALRCVPLLLPTLLYLVLYAGAGYGTEHTGGYVNPFVEPFAFLRAAALRLPALLAELLTVVPSGISHLGDTQALLLAALGGVATLFVGVALVRRRGALGDLARPLGWLWVGTVVALLPFTCTLIGGRVELLPMVGSSTALAVLLARLPPDRPTRGAARALGRLGIALLTVLHLGLAPALRVATQLGLASAARAQAALPSRARLRCPDGAPLLLVNGSDPTLGMYAGAILANAALQGGRSLNPRGGWALLTMAPNDLELERLGPRSFELRVLGERHPHVLERFFRAPSEALRAGERVRVAAFEARVVEVTAGGPARVRFTLPQPLEQACFLRWTGGKSGRLESVDWPATGTLRVPRDPGPMGF